MSVNKIDVLKTWNSLGRLFGKQIDPEMAELMLGSVSDMPLEAVLASLRAWPSQNRTFPMPADIRAHIQGVKPKAPDEKDEGTVIAGKIWEAISRFGSYRGEQAKEFIGDRGWGAVQMLGGWRTTCESTTLDGRANFFAQVRDLLTSARRVEHQEETRETYAALPMPTLKSIE
jgi:hypothetical protein